jgi:hypothetical protein
VLTSVFVAEPSAGVRREASPDGENN